MRRRGFRNFRSWRYRTTSDIVVDLALLRAHAVLEQKCSTVNEGLLQELLGLATKRALANAADASPQFVGLVDDERTIVTVAKHLAEGSQVSEQSAGGLDVLREAPELVSDSCFRETL